jgi:hypothetical protein
MKCVIYHEDHKNDALKHTSLNPLTKITEHKKGDYHYANTWHNRAHASIGG